MTLTRQQVFDKAYIGLAAQGFQQSMDTERNCRYRSYGGLKCAIGHCIPDELYDSEMEGKSIEEGFIAVFLPGFLADHDNTFLKDLQICHDEADEPRDMEGQLRNFAEQWGLTVPEVTP